MSLKPRLSSYAANVAANAVCFLASRLAIFEGVKPLDADEPLVDQLLLAELRFLRQFLPAVDGIAECRELLAESAAPATGRPTWFRVFAVDDSVLFDGTVGFIGDKAESNMMLSHEVIEAGAIVSVVSVVYEQIRQ